MIMYQPKIVPRFSDWRGNYSQAPFVSTPGRGCMRGDSNPYTVSVNNNCYKCLSLFKSFHLSMQIIVILIDSFR